MVVLAMPQCCTSATPCRPRSTVLVLKRQVDSGTGRDDGSQAWAQCDQRALRQAVDGKAAPEDHNE